MMADVGDVDSALLDELGEWSHIKHEILEKYAHAYTTIIKNQRFIKKVIYIDAYAGTGFGVDRETGEQLRGSAVLAMETTPPFDELHLIEQDGAKAAVLESVTRNDARVTVHRGDGITTTESLLDRARYSDYRRALCLLDPYDLSVPWSLVQRIGQMQSVEIFYNFLIMDANRNALWKDPSRVSPERRAKFELVWGDGSWMSECYEEEPTLFGPTTKKLPLDAIAEAFRKRLQTVAGFRHVPQPIAMKNSTNATVYYLFFASPNATANKIVDSIFSKYRRR